MVGIPVNVFSTISAMMLYMYVCVHVYEGGREAGRKGVRERKSEREKERERGACKYMHT